MEFYNSVSGGSLCETDHGPKPYAANIMQNARQNTNFRTAFWTGNLLQMTLMCIPVYGDIGTEMHPDTDQLLRVEGGRALVLMGPCKEEMIFRCKLNTGDAVFVPAGTWHNIYNAGNTQLKLSSVYAPPNHPRGTVHRTKADSEY